MSFAASGSRTISNGGGLVGAVHSTSGSASLRRQLTRTLSAGVSGSYGDNPGFECSVSIQHGVQHRRAYHLCECIGAAPIRPKLQCAAGVRPIAPKLRQHRGNLGQSRYQCGIGDDLLSILATTGKVNMVEEFDEQNPQEFNLQKYLGIARRRHWHFLIPLFIGWLAVWGASWVLPSRYRSGTLILVEQPSMPKDYVTPNVSDDLQERLASITQQILSRTRLLHIIDELNLYAKDRSRLTPDDLVERMRKDIEIELVRDDRREVTSFNVYYTSSDPHVAQQVTSELTNLFISENEELRQQKSEDTTKFLESQLETARQALAEQEEKVRVFKDQHLGELPTQLAGNLQILTGLQSQLQNEEDALNTAKQQNAYLQSLVEQYRALQRSPKSSDGTAPIGLPAIDQELDKLKAQLADLSSHYTDRHPDVRKVKEQIAKTEQTRDKIIADLKNKPASTPASGDTPAISQDDVDPRESSPMLQLQSQLKANQIEITNREHDLVALKAKINEYQGRLNQEPVREQQFADLTRGYEQSKANYDDLLKKKNSSQMATSMELLQEGEHFRMIDPPSLPAKPDFPNRLKLCGMGLGIGLALGAVFAGGAEFMDDRLYAEKEIKDLLPVTVMAEIPAIGNPEDERRQRRKLWAAWAMTGRGFGWTILAGSALSYFRGIKIETVNVQIFLQSEAEPVRDYSRPRVPFSYPAA